MAETSIEDLHCTPDIHRGILSLVTSLYNGSDPVTIVIEGKEEVGYHFSPSMRTETTNGVGFITKDGLRIYEKCDGKYRKIITLDTNRFNEEVKTLGVDQYLKKEA